MKKTGKINRSLVVEIFYAPKLTATIFDDLRRVLGRFCERITKTRRNMFFAISF